MSCVNNEEMGRDKELTKLKTQQSINRILKKTDVVPKEESQEGRMSRTG